MKLAIGTVNRFAADVPFMEGWRRLENLVRDWLE